MNESMHQMVLSKNLLTTRLVARSPEHWSFWVSLMDFEGETHQARRIDGRSAALAWATSKLEDHGVYNGDDLTHVDRIVKIEALTKPPLPSDLGRPLRPLSNW